MLTDTGPLVALVNRNDPHHAPCLTVLKRLPAAPLVTTWPCFTEAMYLGTGRAAFPHRPRCGCSAQRDAS